MRLCRGKRVYGDIDRDAERQNHPLHWFIYVRLISRKVKQPIKHGYQQIVSANQQTNKRRTLNTDPINIYICSIIQQQTK